MAGYARKPFPVREGMAPALLSGKSAVDCIGAFVVLVWLSTGRLGSVSFDAAEACVTAVEPESVLPLFDAGVEAAGRLKTGRLGSWSSTGVCDFAAVVDVLPDESSPGPIVGLELDSLPGRFITGRSESLPVVLVPVPVEGAGCPPLVESPA